MSPRTRGQAASLTVTNQSRATTPSTEDTGPSSLQPEVRRSRSRSELSLAPIGELQLGPAAATAGRGPLSPAGPAGGRGQLSRENSSLGTVAGRQSGAATPATEVGT